MTDTGWWWSRFRITVEPIMMACYIVSSTSGSPLVDLAIRQCCKTYGFDRNSCTSDYDVDTSVGETAANFSMILMIIDTLPGCIISLFVSPWSDANGRKPGMIFSIAGVILSQLMLSWMSTIDDIHPYTLLLSGIPKMSGGLILTLLSCYSYVIDVTNIEDRSIRFAIVNAVTLGSPVLGSVISLTLTKIGYKAVFGFNAFLLTLVAVYIIFCLPESVEKEKETRTSLFTYAHLVDSFHTFLKKRPGRTRGILFAITLLSMAYNLQTMGEMEVRYQSLIEVFNWQLSDYTKYTIFTTTLILLCTLGGVYIGNTYLKIDEMKLALSVLLTASSGSLLMACAPTSISFFIFSQLRCFSACVSPLSKGVISILVDPADVSKVIAFINTVDAFMPQLGAITYTSFYDFTVYNFPFTIYLLSSGLQFFGCFCIADLVPVMLEAQDSNGLRARTVVASAYFPGDDAEVPPLMMQQLIHYCRREDLQLIVGCDANAHNMAWGSTDKWKSAAIIIKGNSPTVTEKRSNETKHGE